MKNGDWLSEEALEKETVRSSAVMRNKGYYDFNKNHYFFEADTLSIPDTAILKMTVNGYTRNETPDKDHPIRKFYFNDVTLSYPKTLRIREKVLRELNMIAPGNVYSSDVVNNTYSRLSALRMFSSVNISMTQADTNLVDCVISLSQSKMQGFKVNSRLQPILPDCSECHRNCHTTTRTFSMEGSG